MPEGMLGRRVRCFGCDERFIATPDSAAARPQEPPYRPGGIPSGGEPKPSGEQGDDSQSGGPYCPGCAMSVPWHARYCPHCGEEFDDAPRDRRADMPPRRRRDAVPHRGQMLSTLGNITLGAGALSLCLMGTGALVAVPLGIAVLFMAQSDLGQMRQGTMDPQGQQMTETARASAIGGLVLGLIFAAGYGAMVLTHL